MTIDIGRREFIWALGGTGLLWSFTARAQQSSKLPTIGFLGPDRDKGMLGITLRYP